MHRALRGYVCTAVAPRLQAQTVLCRRLAHSVLLGAGGRSFVVRWPRGELERDERHAPHETRGRDQVDPRTTHTCGRGSGVSRKTTTSNSHTRATSSVVTGTESPVARNLEAPVPKCHGPDGKCGHAMTKRSSARATSLSPRPQTLNPKPETLNPKT